MTVTKNQIRSLESTLEEFGLTRREARVYLYLLEHPDQKAFVIAKALSLPCATIYLTLASLCELGVVSIFKKNNIAYYSAESASRLAKIAEHKNELIKSILPGLNDLSKKRTFEPAVRLYSGKESIKYVFKSLYEDLEAKGIKKFYTFSHPELQDQFPRYLPELLAWKKRLKIHTSLIVPGEYKNQIAAKYPSYIADEYRETRFLPSEFPFRGTMMLAAEKVAIFSMIDDEVYAVTIESPIMVNMLKQVFLFTWDMIGKR